MNAYKEHNSALFIASIWDCSGISMICNTSFKLLVDNIEYCQSEVEPDPQFYHP
jgi:ABC-type transporter Mla MlaB component